MIFGVPIFLSCIKNSVNFYVAEQRIIRFCSDSLLFKEITYLNFGCSLITFGLTKLFTSLFMSHTFKSIERTLVGLILLKL